MKAAVLRAYGEAPTFGEFSDPEPIGDEVRVSVSAVALSPLVRSLASGSHYASNSQLPTVPGFDGVGTTADGQRVYFGFLRPPYGSLAERTVVAPSHVVALPAALDDVTAAAAANPGFSCWGPFTRLAPIRAGESVLINGGTGVAGRTAIQVARHLGAAHVVVTGRNAGKLVGLSDLGADVTVPLDLPPDAFRDRVRALARELKIGVVLDYLWGPSAEALLSAFGGPGAPRGGERVRYVHVGGLGGPTITLSGSLLRSSGVEVLGSGLGSMTDTEAIQALGGFFEACVAGHFRIQFVVEPLFDIERVWKETGNEPRVVLRVR